MKYFLILLVVVVLIFGFVWLQKNEVPADSSTNKKNGLGGFLVNNQGENGGYDGSGIAGGLFDFSNLFGNNGQKQNSFSNIV
jgi:hypothetical protein